MNRSQFAWLAPLAASSLILLPACSDDVSTPDAPKFGGVTLTQLQSAPETLDLAQQDYRLRTDLWRDFMPIAPADGRPLSAVVRLESLDQQPIPDNVKLTHLWVINGNRVWSTRFSAIRPTEANAIEAFAANGPKWGPGISVDVVVGVTVGSSEFRLVRAPAQPIGRTD